MFNLFIRKKSFIFFLISGMLLFSCHIVKHGKDNPAPTPVKVFAVNEETYKNQIIPEIRDNANELELVISKLRADKSQAEKELGIQKDNTSPFNFIIKGVLPIKSLDRSLRAGILILDIPDLSADGFCRVQVGPVIKGSMVRDSLSFISFNDFPGGQVPFGEVSRDINFYIRDNIVNGVDDSFSAGKMVELMGVCTCDSSGVILITPVSIKLVGGENNG